MKKIFNSILCLFLFITINLSAQPKPGKINSVKSAVPKPIQIVTHHSITIDGKEIIYTATTGTFLLKNENDTAISAYRFYCLHKRRRNSFWKTTVTFAYNGGPGSSSMWLHMGALGPKRVVLDDPDCSPPAPYETADNNFLLLMQPTL